MTDSIIQNKLRESSLSKRIYSLVIKTTVLIVVLFLTSIVHKVVFGIFNIQLWLKLDSSFMFYSSFLVLFLLYNHLNTQILYSQENNSTLYGVIFGTLSQSSRLFSSAFFQVIILYYILNSFKSFYSTNNSNDVKYNDDNSIYEFSSFTYLLINSIIVMFSFFNCEEKQLGLRNVSKLILN